MKTKSMPLFNLKTWFILFWLCSALQSSVSFAQTMNRPDRIFAKKGIMWGAWMHVDGADEGKPLGRITSIPIGRTGRYVRIQLPHTDPLSLAEVQVFSQGVNVARNKSTQQSSNNSATTGLSNLAVDGNVDGDWRNGSVTHTRGGNTEMEPWWQVDLGSTVTIDSIHLWNRTDSSNNIGDHADITQRSKGFYLFVSNTSFSSGTLAGTMAQTGDTWYSQPGALHYPVGAELANSGFAPAYWERPMYNYTIAKQNPTAKWSQAMAPYNIHYYRPPTSFEQSNGFLNSLQLTNLNNLNDILIMDEESYSDNLVNSLKGWYEIIHAKYPDVAAHNNQSMWGWSNYNISRYIQAAQPDLINLDYYYFWYFVTGSYPGNSWAVIMGDFQHYRDLALKGIDGSGKSPIAYGAFLQGGVGNCCGRSNYYPSESELNVGVYHYLVMGAKWLNCWWYVGGKEAVFTRNDGSLTPQYWQYANLGVEVKNLSPHLSKLRSTDLRILPGQNLSNGTVVNNNPMGLRSWDATADPYITDITATNLQSGTNNGLKGDVTVGFFRPVPGIANTPGVTMAPVIGKDTRYFMVVNGLTKTNGWGNPPSVQDTAQGKAIFARQRIVLNIDFKNNPVDTLYRVRRSDGGVERVNLTPAGGTKYFFADTLDGGKGNLFYWKNAGSLNSGIISGGTYKLVSDVNGTSVLDVTGFGTSDATTVALWQNNDGTNQQWVVTYQGNGYYKLQPVHAPGKALDVRGAGSADGSQVQIYADNSTHAQKWMITPVDGGFYNLSPACAPGSNLDVNGGGTTNGTKVQIRGFDITPAQRWKFVLVAPPGGASATSRQTATANADALQHLKDRTAGIKVYPNPVTDGMLYVDLPSSEASNAVVSLFDMAGKNVFSAVKSLAKGTSRIDVNMSSLPAGIYILQIEQGNKREQYKIMKK